MKYKEINAFIKYKLELADKKMPELADALDLHYQGLYRKLNGMISMKQEEKDKIDEYLELTKEESSQLWKK